MRNKLKLRIRDLDRVGALLDQVVTLGANSISGPNFTVADPTPLEDQARRAAMRDALRKGTLYAEAAGVRSARSSASRRATASRRSRYADGRHDAHGGGGGCAVPIEGGELTFQAQVSVSWRLAD